MKEKNLHAIHNKDRRLKGKNGKKYLSQEAPRGKIDTASSTLNVFRSPSPNLERRSISAKISSLQLHFFVLPSCDAAMKKLIVHSQEIMLLNKIKNKGQYFIQKDLNIISFILLQHFLLHGTVCMRMTSNASSRQVAQK